MKKLLVYLFAVTAIALTSCKGNSTKSSTDTVADTTQLMKHDSAAVDSSGNASGTTNAPKDTLKTNP